MARLSSMLPEDEKSRSLDEGNQSNRRVAGIMMHRPEIAKGVGAFTEALRTKGTLPPRLQELVRLRIAFHNQCRSCMAIRYSDAVDDGVTEALVCSLEKPYDAPDLTEAEKVALKFADLFATNHLEIGDELYAELGKHFNEGEIVELGLNCALDVGMGRLAATWKVTDELPDAFQAEGTVTPWGQAGLLVT